MRRIALLLCVASVPAMAHEAPSGWSYDALCCSNMDCAPVVDQQMLPDGAIKATTSHGTTVFPRNFPKDRILISKDHDAHACMKRDRPKTELQEPICLYVPAMF